MAITARLVGKLGGADVEEVQVSMDSFREAKEFVLQRVEVPSGERRLVVVDGVFTQISSNDNYHPLLVVGDQKISVGNRNTATPNVWSGGGVLSQTGNVSIETITTGNSHNVTFSGTLYIIPFD